jgi:hypothetical protein
MSLRIQPQGVKTLMNHAIREAIGDTIFFNAFIRSSTTTLGQKVMKSAYNLGLTHLVHRCKHDTAFVQYASNVVRILPLLSS